MPVLDREPDLYPSDLLGGFADQGGDRRWIVAYTRARQEKVIARSLYAHQVPFYLPLFKKTLVYRNRRIKSHMPLFPGYVFLFASPDERTVCLTTNCVSRMLAVDDPASLVRQLHRVWQLIAANAPLTPESRIAAGTRVRVRWGVLAGLEGTVLKRQGKTHLVIGVDFIQKGASVQIDDHMLEPLG